MVVFFFFKQKTAYEMRISDWSSDVCSSDLGGLAHVVGGVVGLLDQRPHGRRGHDEMRLDALDAFQDLERANAVDDARCACDCHDEPLHWDTPRSEERRVGQEGVSTCRFRWSPYH